MWDVEEQEADEAMPEPPTPPFEEVAEEEGYESEEKFIKQLPPVKPPAKVTQSPAAFVGNGLGSGTFQKIRKDLGTALNRRVEAAKKEPKVPEAKVPEGPKKAAWGSTNKTAVEVNQEELDLKRKDAQEKFKGLLHDKMVKQAQGDPKLQAHMA